VSMGNQAFHRVYHAMIIDTEGLSESPCETREPFIGEKPLYAGNMGGVTESRGDMLTFARAGKCYENIAMIKESGDLFGRRGERAARDTAPDPLSLLEGVFDPERQEIWTDLDPGGVFREDPTRPRPP
jgi:hypothetical protein